MFNNLFKLRFIVLMVFSFVLLTLIFVGIQKLEISAASTNISLNNRVIEDRPDDIPGYQIHVLYVLPKDGNDTALDTNGKIATSVAAWQQWFLEQTGGQRLKLDNYQGVLDITFVRLQQTDAEIQSSDTKMRDRIEAELQALGFNKPQKVYAVYYGGSSSNSCGGNAWPPGKTGNVAAVFLNSTGIRQGRPCETNKFATSINQPGGIELEIIHQIIHTIGAAQPCAPHYTEKPLPGHVSDSSKDLLYQGDELWQPSVLDVGRDDYFQHHKPRCFDLAKSVFLEPTASDAVPPPGWSTNETFVMYIFLYSVFAIFIFWIFYMVRNKFLKDLKEGN